MTPIEESLSTVFCPETVADIKIALDSSGTNVRYNVKSLLEALTWDLSTQKFTFWYKIQRTYQVLAQSYKSNVSVDIYFL
jgi:hypothetical protein